MPLQYQPFTRAEWTLLLLLIFLVLWYLVDEHMTNPLHKLITHSHMLLGFAWGMGVIPGIFVSLGSLLSWASAYWLVKRQPRPPKTSPPTSSKP